MDLSQAKRPQVKEHTLGHAHHDAVTSVARTFLLYISYLAHLEILCAGNSS